MAEVDLQKQYLVMMVGLTHSGKTTFGGLLGRSLSNAFVLDSDLVRTFLKDSFPLLFFSPQNEDRGLQSYDLTKILFFDVLRFGLESHFFPILTNGNLRRDLRLATIKKIRSFGAKLIMVYFHFPKEILLQRIAYAQKSTHPLRSSNSFEELLEKQIGLFDSPMSDETDYFFEVDETIRMAQVVTEIESLIKV